MKLGKMKGFHCQIIIKVCVVHSVEKCPKRSKTEKTVPGTYESFSFEFPEYILTHYFLNIKWI